MEYLFSSRRARAARVVFAAAAAALVALLAACGGDYPQPVDATAAPTIAAFGATPATVPAGGGAVVLSWSSIGASQLTIDNGVGDVSGGTTKTVMVTASTTFTLTAANASGTSTASTVVAVAAVPAPTITGFTATPATLPVGGGSVTLAWTTGNATALSIDNGVGDVSGLTSKVVGVAADTTFTLTAGNAAGSATASTKVSLAAAADRFVDPVAGSDANACTAVAPCRSIAKALTGAPSGSTLALADGLYTSDPAGGFVTGVPDGVTLRATHAGAATLANMDLFLHGSATVDGVVIDRTGPTQNTCADITAQGSSTVVTTLTLVGVFSNCPRWLNLGPNVKATLTPGSLGGGLYTTALPPDNQQFLSITGAGAELLIQGGAIDGGNVVPTQAAGAVLNVFAGAKLTLDGVTLKNYAARALTLNGQAILRNGTAIDHVGIPGDPGPLSGGLNQCTTTTAIHVDQGGSLTMDHATLSNVASSGICVHPAFLAAGVVSVQVTQSTFAHITGAALESYVDAGIGTTPPAALGPTIGIDSTTFTDTGRAIFWFGLPGVSLTLNNVTVTASTAAANTGGSTESCNGAAIRFDTGTQPGSLKMRNSTIASNPAEGLCIVGASPAVDLGTSGDPGGNTITGNATTGLGFFVVATGTPASINAIGNTWAAGQQGADANGRYSVAPAYAAVPKTGPATGVNFTIGSALGTANF